jgi:hypothetical protein
MSFLNRRVKAALLLLALLTLGVWAFLRAPFWVATYVNDKYPFVEIRGEDLKLGYPKVEVKNVRVKLEWLEGTLTEVVVDIDKNVWIHGGHVTANLDRKPKTESLGKGAVTLKEVSLDSVKVLYKDQIQADMIGLRSTPEGYCVQRGDATLKDDRIPKNLFDGAPTVKFEGACVKRDRTLATAKWVYVDIKLPDNLPKLSGTQRVGLHNVEVFPSDKYLKAERLRLGDGTYVEGNLITFTQSDGSLYFDAESVSTNHSWISPGQSEFRKVSLDIPVTGGLGKVSLNGVTLHYSLGDHYVEGDQLCSEWVDALPSPSEVFRGMASNFKGYLAFDIKAKPIPHVSLRKDCKYTCSESPIKELRGRFSYEAYKRDGVTPFTRQTGRSTPEWVPLEDLPVNIASAFIRMEDPSFLSHRGILTASLKVALEQNMAKGYFFRGGSTITQQLAKNLWLKRHKTVGRKVEEAFLTMALESCLTRPKYSNYTSMWWS